MSSGLYNNWLAETEGHYNQYHGNTSFNGTTTKAVLGQTVTIIEKDENEVYSFEFEDQMIETPKTGDESHLKLWISLFVVSFIILAILIYKFFKKLYIK